MIRIKFSLEISPELSDSMRTSNSFYLSLSRIVYEYFINLSFYSGASSP